MLRNQQHGKLVEWQGTLQSATLTVETCMYVPAFTFVAGSAVIELRATSVNKEDAYSVRAADEGNWSCVEE